MVKYSGEPLNHTGYRQRVGTALYINVTLRLDISNCVRELAQHMDSPGKEQWVQLQYLILYLNGTRDDGFVLRGDGKLEIIGYVDSDFATDSNNRRSVTGYVVFIGNSLVSWKSKQQGCVTMSSTEAEYYAMSQCAAEMVFIRNVLRDFGFGNLRMEMRCDNSGAIFIARNMAVGQRTKHIDTRCHYVRELVETGELEVIYVKTTDNVADLLMKNLGSGSFGKFAEVLKTGNISTLEEGGCSE